MKIVLMIQNNCWKTSKCDNNIIKLGNNVCERKCKGMTKNMNIDSKFLIE